MSVELVAHGALRLHLRTPTLPPATATNTLIVGGSRLVVIEPATPYERERSELDDTLARLAAEGRTVQAVLVTHHHVDHTGYAEALAQRLGVPILAHAETASRVSFAVDRHLGDGDVIELDEGFAVRAVFTPGHAPGHLVFHELKTGLVYAGDLVAAEGTILIDPEDDGDMGQYLTSLTTLGTLGATALVPSHGRVLNKPDAVVEHYVQHRLAREAKVLAALGDGPQGFDDLLALVYVDTPKAIWPLAARSLEAHLVKLVRERRVARDDILITRLDG